jgi:hypothetical protein
MIGLTVWASVESNVMVGFQELFATRWGIATLGDAYCGFLTFYAWVFYKERTAMGRIAWFIIIMIFGNIAMSFYMLKILMTLAPDARAEDILLRHA